MKTYILLATVFCGLLGCHNKSSSPTGLVETNTPISANGTDLAKTIKDTAFLKLVSAYKYIEPGGLNNMDSIFYSFPLDRDIEDKKIKDPQMVKYLFPDAGKYKACSVFYGIKFSIDDCLFLLSYVNRSLDTTIWGDTLFLHLNLYSLSKGSMTGFDIAANNTGEAEPTYTMQSKFYLDSLGLKIVTGAESITDTNIYLHHAAGPVIEGMSSTSVYRINFKGCKALVLEKTSTPTKLKTVPAGDYTFETLAPVK